VAGKATLNRLEARKDKQMNKLVLAIGFVLAAATANAAPKKNYLDTTRIESGGPYFDLGPSCEEKFVSYILNRRTLRQSLMAEAHCKRK
jgi:hypothetical protein